MGKSKKTHGLRQKQLNRQSEVVHASKTKTGIDSLCPIGRQTYSDLQQSKASSYVMVTLRRQTHRITESQNHRMV